MISAAAKSIGSLTSAATKCRITDAVSLDARFCQDSGEALWIACKARSRYMTPAP